jgi:hypothetical protein
LIPFYFFSFDSGKTSSAVYGEQRTGFRQNIPVISKIDPITLDTRGHHDVRDLPGSDQTGTGKTCSPAGILLYSGKAWSSMRFTALFGVLFILAFGILAAGCIGSAPQSSVSSPVPTAIPTEDTTITPIPTTIPTVPILPGSTQAMPSATAVSVSIEKGGTYATTIIATFNGGKGMNLVSKIDVSVTHPDTSVVSGTLEKPVKGATLELDGTNGSDRVRVVVTMMSGDIYTIVDQPMGYKVHG